MVKKQEQKMKVSPDVRSYALDLVENGLVDMEVLLRACLGYMTSDDVAHMLDLNEMSPRFMQEEIAGGDRMMTTKEWEEWVAKTWKECQDRAWAK